MSPKVLEAGPHIFGFTATMQRFEYRASIHIGRSSQDDENDAKVWLEPKSSWPALVVDYASTNCGRSWQLLKRTEGSSWRNGMVTNVALADEKIQVKRYKIQHSISDYTFPEEASIHQIELDETFLHVELSDGRRLSIPLWWIPTVYHAGPQERQKYEISRNRKLIIWDPDKCAINDEVRIADYLGPVTEPIS